MRVFKDKNGLEWRVVIDIGVCREARQRFDINLYKVADDEFATLAKVVEDPVMLADILFLACGSQAKERNMAIADFEAVFNGDAVRAAAKALTDELLDFSLAPASREAFGAAIRKGQEVQTAAAKLLMAKVEATSTESLVKKWSDTSGDSPVSQASIQTGSLTGS